ncbi:Hypothetical predicted protein [Octopus vulgaris]|uniref:Uncharacterized protein n=1 Tax=Octopus vulgaris TaxID=6645 RepID=A0AA36F4B7_OCTVU|nr:Hypothetical predicted protein [Octopus vulgaris]
MSCLSKINGEAVLSEVMLIYRLRSIGTFRHYDIIRERQETHKVTAALSHFLEAGSNSAKWMSVDSVVIYVDLSRTFN